MSYRVIVVLLVLVSPLVAQPKAERPTKDWKLDELIAANGAKYQGIILEETPNGVRFRVVRRPPGRATVTLTTCFQAKEVDRIVRISDAEREIVRAKLAELDPTGAGERKRMEELDLTTTQWLDVPNGAKRYDAERFILVSSASEEITRRAAVRLEQIFTAYERFLQPLVQPRLDRPLTIFLAPDKSEYMRLLSGIQGPVLNPAIFDSASNRIICGTDLRRLGQDLSAARVHNVQQLAALDKYESDIRQIYKDKDSRLERDRYLATVSEQRKKIHAVEVANESKFNESTAQLFALLYHETFHAYVSNYVYPPRSMDEVRAGKGTGELPRWLNEGLAQIFESAILDAGELRVGHVDRERFNRIKELRKTVGLLPVGELIRAGSDAFVTTHTIQKTSIHRNYLTSWAIAFHLVFEKKLLGTKELDQYLIRLNSGEPTDTAFAKLVGKDIESYDRELNDFIDRLRPDGSLESKR